MRQRGPGVVASLIVLGVTLLAACKTERERKPAGASHGQPTESGDASQHAEASTAQGFVDANHRADASEQGHLTDERVLAVVDHWLAAQNKGSWFAYEKLFADKFSGIKRAGARVFHFDREGWLRDRKRMFRKAMTVEATERQLMTTDTAASVRFVQRWKSGSFEDIGHKRLFIVLEDGEPKIAREEMLTSEVEGRERDWGAGDFRFLLDAGLELSGATIPDKTGKPKLVNGPGADPAIVRAAVAEEDLDPATRAWKGKKVRVDGSCEAMVTGFHLVSRATHHFGTVDQWHCAGPFANDPDCKKASHDEIAQVTFGHGKPAVIAELDGCHDGLFARSASQPPLLAAEAIRDTELKTAALKAFGNLPEVVEQQSDGPGRSEPGWWKGKQRVTMFEHPVSKEVLVSVTASNDGHCGDLVARAWQIWKVTDKGLEKVGFEYAAPQIAGAFDIDADGNLELLTDGSDSYDVDHQLLDTKTMSYPMSQTYSYNDCPC